MNPREYEALFETEDGHWWFRGLWREVDRAIARYAPRRERGLVWLDAGSGTGGLLARLAREPRGRFRLAAGLELATEGLALARRRNLQGLCRGSVSRLPVRDGALDVLTSIDVLCHRSVEAAAALAEAARCLSPGGILVFQVPAYQWLFSGHDRAVWSNRRFHRAEVRGMMTAAGLRPLSCIYRNSLLFPVAAARRLVSREKTRRPDRSDVGPATASVNAIGTAAMRIEAGLRRGGVSLPFGLSVFCVAAR